NAAPWLEVSWQNFRPRGRARYYLPACGLARPASRTNGCSGYDARHRPLCHFSRSRESYCKKAALGLTALRDLEKKKSAQKARSFYSLLCAKLNGYCSVPATASASGGVVSCCAVAACWVRPGE